jgi:hypothetical protein
MNRKTQQRRYQSKESGKDLLDSYIEKRVNKRQSEPSYDPPLKKRTGRIIAAVIVFAAALYFMNGLNSNNSFFTVTSPVDFVESVINSTSEPSQDLLNRMNELMVEMGYLDLTDDDLRSLRADGVTATYISNMRALGYDELTLDDARRLARSDVSSAFTAMMIELGYELSVDDLVELRNAGVTAFFTSNVHDLGYRDVTKEQLIRMQTIGLTTSIIEQLQAERGEDVPLEDVIRYRISNQ